MHFSCEEAVCPLIQSSPRVWTTAKLKGHNFCCLQAAISPVQHKACKPCLLVVAGLSIWEDHWACNKEGLQVSENTLNNFFCAYAASVLGKLRRFILGQVAAPIDEVLILQRISLCLFPLQVERLSEEEAGKNSSAVACRKLVHIVGPVFYNFVCSTRGENFCTICTETWSMPCRQTFFQDVQDRRKGISWI